MFIVGGPQTDRQICVPLCPKVLYSYCMPIRIIKLGQDLKHRMSERERILDLIIFMFMFLEEKNLRHKYQLPCIIFLVPILITSHIIWLSKHVSFEGRYRQHMESIKSQAEGFRHRSLRNWKHWGCLAGIYQLWGRGIILKAICKELKKRKKRKIKAIKVGKRRRSNKNWLGAT